VRLIPLLQVRVEAAVVELLISAPPRSMPEPLRVRLVISSLWPFRSNTASLPAAGAAVTVEPFHSWSPPVPPN